ncbi:MAG: M60 family metallopeptidase [Alloprevotella sp.]|nr:M60 family metallopeptidase [Alloprevotella sp.]
MKRNLITLTTLALLVAGLSNGFAQDVLPKEAAPLLLTGHSQTVSYRERTVHIDVTANVDWTFSVDKDWAQAYRSVNGVFVHVPTNFGGEPRTATLTIASADGHTTQTVELTQGANEAAEDLPTDTTVRPSVVTANNSQSGNAASNMRDGDYGTFWHTSYGSNKFSVSDSNPAVITFSFNNVERIDYINYVPRQDGTRNGDFKRVEMLVQLQGETEYKSFGTYNWASNSAPKMIEPASPILNPKSIQFKVYEGDGDFASCAEMEFCVRSGGNEEYEIFADDLYTTLKAGVTMSDVELLSNPLVQSLAYQILQGGYSTDYRAASYECHNSPQYYSNLWKAPGKYYDQIAGVTGIHVEKGKHAVIVRDIPEGMGATLKVVAWYVGKDGSNFDGGNPNTSEFGLHNGVNVINYTYDWPGLAYICYYDDNGTSATRKPIRVHFVNGIVNGYLSPDKTNDAMHKLTANAVNTCMDVVGTKVHSIWTAKGLNSYCKSIDGKTGYRQYMNVLDSLVTWEQRLLGFYKYDRVPDLRTMAYTNYTYYMFQGGFGVSFHHNQESRVLNCKTIVQNDEDAIWGLSHEWGHQHQMAPYFNWAGMSEVTNNMNSYYNIMHMGYKNSRDAETWKTAAGKFLNDDSFKDGAHESDHRKQAAANYSECSWNSKLQTLARNQSATIQPYATAPRQAVALQEVGLDESLAAFTKLYCYFRDNGFPEFAEDWYEALRQSDLENGSQIEKKGGVDKYELLASAQNGSTSKWTAYKQAYPNSVWTKNNYVSPSNGWYSNSTPFILNYIRKVSRLSGYNLFPYFEKWGFLRCIAMRVGDYGNKWQLMTDDMYDEFEADMQALVDSGELKAMPEGMVDEISLAGDRYFTRPNFPN